MTAVVPCFDTAQLSLYNSACLDLNPLGGSDSWVNTAPSTFTCVAIVPSQFWDNLDGAGLGTCVCAFSSNDGGTSTFTGSYGTCNGVCTSPTFTCDGTTPESGNGGSGGGSGGAVTSSVPFFDAPVTNSNTLITPTIATLSTTLTAPASSFTPEASTTSKTTPAVSTAPTTSTPSPASSGGSSSGGSKSSQSVPLAVNWTALFLSSSIMLFGAATWSFN